MARSNKGDEANWQRVRNGWALIIVGAVLDFLSMPMWHHGARFVAFVLEMVGLVMIGQAINSARGRSDGKSDR